MYALLPRAFVALFPSRKVAQAVALIVVLALAYWLWTRVRSEVRSAAAYRPDLKAFEERQLGKPSEFYTQFADELYNSLSGVFDWPSTKIRLLEQLNAMSDAEAAWVAHLFNTRVADESESLLSYIEAEYSVPSNLRRVLVQRLTVLAQNTSY